MNILQTKNLILENLKIDYIPLVITSTLFNIVKHNTDIKGYWKQGNKIYIDNIELVTFSAIDDFAFSNAKNILFKSGEKCIAYKNKYNELVIQYPKGNKDILRKRIAWIETRKPTKKYINALLTFHSGLTIYKLKDNTFLIEIYKG